MPRLAVIVCGHAIPIGRQAGRYILYTKKKKLSYKEVKMGNSGRLRSEAAKLILREVCDEMQSKADIFGYLRIFPMC